MVKRPYFLQYIDIRSYFLQYTASIEQGEESIHPLYLTRGGEYPPPSIEQGEENIHPQY